ncbi:MAG: NAD(P)-dependent oxidoreductase [Thermoleophilia bacterium]
MARVAFVGIGTMGLHMARRVAAGGFELVVCDVDPARAAAVGAATAATAAEAAAGADAILLSLPSVAIVEQVGLELAAAAAPGATVIDMSTSPPALARRIAAACAGRGVSFLDAPVSGGPTGAEAGSLAIMVGGEADVFARWQTLLATMGARVEHVGGHGAGQAVKLANNVMVAANMAVMAEACTMLEREGVDLAQAYEVFTRSTSDSSVMRRRFPVPGVRPEHPATNDYDPMFRLDLLVKDASLALDLAAEHGVEAATATAALGLYRAALERGYGPLDYSAVILALTQPGS